MRLSLPRLRLPHPLILILGGIAVAAVLTWILPAGAYQRHADPATGRELVIPGSYATTAPSPVGPAAAVLSAARGIVAGADVILSILFVGGAFALLDATGALGRLVSALVGRTRRPRVVVVVISILFATLGALESMHEEIVALVPPMLALSASLGFGAVTALAMSVGAAVVGAAFGPTNPYVTVIALRFAGIPNLSQPALRLALLVVAVAVWIAWTLWQIQRDDVHAARPETPSGPATRRDVALLTIALLPFIPYVIGVVRLDWGFNELSALFLLVGLAIGLVSGLDLSGSAAAFLEAMKGMIAPGIFVGVARGISIVLTDGRVIDTIVHGLATALTSVPAAATPALMVVAHAILHVPVPSVSGQAVLTMPIMAPLADVRGISRDAAVIAYQTGAGLMDMITPTDGALLAMLLAARVSYGRWLRFAVPGALLVALVGAAASVIAG